MTRNNCLVVIFTKANAIVNAKTIFVSQEVSLLCLFLVELCIHLLLMMITLKKANVIVKAKTFYIYIYISK